MTLGELIGRVAATAGVSKAEARRIIDALFDPRRGIIQQALRRGDEVHLGAFGRFSVSRRLARAARSPATGGESERPRRVTVTFTPSAQLAAAARSHRSTSSPRRRLKPVPSAVETAAPSRPAAALREPVTPSVPGPRVSGGTRVGTNLPLQLGGERPTDVSFTVHHPKEITPRTWSTLLAYAHTPDALAAVQNDSRARLGGDPDGYGRGTGAATTVVRRGAEITVVPELAGCRFNPRRVTFAWLKDWHRAEFEVQGAPGERTGGRAVNGQVAFFVGPVLVGEVKIWGHLSDGAPRGDPARESASAGAYRRIFVSYAHQDARIVEALSRAYRALGDTYLRDVTALRSGESWNPALLRMVERADVFQLCWSRAAKRSRYVKQEYRHALGLGRQTPFIRPTYWEDPMPLPPRELKSIHFTRLQLV